MTQFSNYLIDINPTEHVNETVEINMDNKKGLRLINSLNMNTEFGRVNDSRDLELNISWQDGGQKNSKIVIKNYYKDDEGRYAQNPDFIYAVRNGHNTGEEIRDYDYTRISEMVSSEQTAIVKKSNKITGTNFKDNIDMTSDELINIKNAIISTGRGDDTIRLNANGATVNCDSGEKQIYVSGGKNTINVANTMGIVNIATSETPNNLVINIKNPLKSFTQINFSNAENLEDLDISLGKGKNKNDVIFKLGEDTVTVKNGLKTISNNIKICSQNEDYIDEIVDILKAKYPNKANKTLGYSNTIFPQTIAGTLMDEKFTTGTGNDKITLYSGYHEVTAGKGNDKVILKNESSALFYLNKGDGNDTIELSDMSGALGIVLSDRNANLSYHLNEKDIILKVTHPKTRNSKKEVVETLTIKNAVEEGRINNVMLYYRDDLDTPIGFEDISQDNPVIYKGNNNKNNRLEGAYAKNTIYGGNKNDYMVSSMENNTFVTGSKGSSYMISTSETANDKYVVKSLDNGTYIYDNGAEDKNILQINGGSINNLFMHFDLDEDFNIEPLMATDSSVTSAHLLSGSNLTKAIQKNSFANALSSGYGNLSVDEYSLEMLAGVREVDLSKVTYKANVKGIGFWALPANFDFELTNKKGAVKTISNNVIINSLQASHTFVGAVVFSIVQKLNEIIGNMEEIPDFLQNLKTCVVDNGKISTQDLINECIKINSLSSKNLSGNDKQILSQFKKYSSQILSDLSNAYKSTFMGTDGADSYTKIKTNKFNMNGDISYTGIVSSTGNDTFSFAKNPGKNVEILSGDGTIRDDKDTLIFSNHAFENGTIKFGMVNNEIITPVNSQNRVAFGLFDYSNEELAEGGYVASTVLYSGLYGEIDENFVQLQNVTVKDKYRSYDVAYLNNEIRVFNNNRNNIIYGINSNNITLNSGYNIVMLNSEGENTINHMSGNDCYKSYSTSDDYYNVFFSKNMVVGIGDSGGEDTLIMRSNNPDDMKLFFNVDKEGNVSDYVKIIDKTAMTSKNLSVKDETIKQRGITLSTVKAGLLVEGEIEHVQINNVAFDMDGMANQIKENVIQWLNDGNKYNSTAEVFESGKKADINSLLQVYKNVNSVDYMGE